RAPPAMRQVRAYVLLVELVELGLGTDAELRVHEQRLRHLHIAGPDRFEQLVRLLPHDMAHMRDLLERRLALDVLGDQSRQDVLQGQAGDPGDEHQGEHDPEQAFERAAPAKITVTENEDNAEEAEPDVAAHPESAGTEPPPRRQLPPA